MNDGFSATVDTSQVDRLLGRLAMGAPRVGADAARDAAESVQGKARSAVPHRSGRLAASITVETTDDDAALVSSVPYAGWIEYGGSRGRPYVSSGRYVGPSAQGAEDLMARSAVRGLDRILVMDLPDKVRVDFAEITFRELGDALDASGVPDLSKATAGQQARANAAFAWVVLRRDHPDVTLEQVLNMPVSAVEIVGADGPGNVPGATDGATPPASPAPGTSNLSPS